LTEQEAFFMARETWQRHGVTQCTHYSESRRREAQILIERMFEHHGIDIADLPNWPTFHKQYKEFTKIKEQAHADYITRLPNTYSVADLDVMVEAKAKELALTNLNFEYCKNTQLILE
jgi:UV DNA damage repair endonuclease